MNTAVDSVLSGDLQATIAELWVYPVKSCGGVSLQSAQLTETGLLHDRTWMVVDAAGDFVTQREWPRMALIQPAFERGQWVLRAPGMRPLHLALHVDGAPVRVRVWDDEVAAFDVGDVAAQWFSDFLGLGAPEGLKRLRLARFDPAARRLCSPAWTGGREAVTQFADGFGVLVTSTASLNALNARLAQSGEAPVGMNRFRPNVVLEGVEAHDEDRIGLWRVEATGGTALLDNLKPCSRCPIPNIDPLTALSSSAVGDALQTYRQDRRLNGAVTFGMNAMPIGATGLVLRVGQVVQADWCF